MNGQVALSREPVGYALLPIRRGLARFKDPGAGTSEDFLDYDFWVTRKPGPGSVAQTLYTDVHRYVSNREPLDQQHKVVWHKTAYNHIPRYEDLGFAPNSFDFSKNNGVALTVYAGFDLVPRNLMHVTPGYK